MPGLSNVTFVARLAVGDANHLREKVATPGPRHCTQLTGRIVQRALGGPSLEAGDAGAAIDARAADCRRHQPRA